MTTTYDRIAAGHLAEIFAAPDSDLARRMGAEASDAGYTFAAFGQRCRLAPEGIWLDGAPASGVPALLIALYARFAVDAGGVDLPLKAFIELPDSAPYAAAFRTHSETPLIPHVDQILAHRETVAARFGGRPAPPEIGGDWTILLQPLPKIALCYAFYLADEEFLPGVTCRFSANAERFLPTDALADVAEYTSRALIHLSQSLAPGE
ncbi:MAG: DUF3786 domain-containing protein [Desulfosarcinaceae bacterium]|nr:DUF3786 domain-containing protein [Desulfosarcinaceae bacterium]